MRNNYEAGSPRTEAGQSLFELVIALIIGVLVVTAIVQLVTISIRNSTFAKNKAEATRLAQQALEWLRSEKKKGWNTFYAKSGNPAVWCTPVLSWQSPSVQTPCTNQIISGSNAFKREVKLDQEQIDTNGDTAPDTNIVVATVTVFWEDGGKSHQTQVTTQFGQTD